MSETHTQNSIGRTLIVCAVHAEAQAVAQGLGFEIELPKDFWSPISVHAEFDVVISGVGKANGAGATALALASKKYGRVISAGVAGSLPGSGLGLGATVIGTASAFSDEGVRTPEGFVSIGDVGFPVTDGIGPSIASGEALSTTLTLPERLLGHATASGVIATVSAGSGTDEHAREVVARTGALCEAMEGAAVALACARLGAQFVEIRAVSNNTGDRGNQTWDLCSALDALSKLFHLVR